jgi:hypothetical protein
MIFKTDVKGVSEIVGFILTFTIISAVTSSLIYTTSIFVERRELIASEIVANDIVNYAVNSILECAAIKQTYPNTNCSITIQIPTNINGKEYYIEATAAKIYVNMTNGNIQVNSTTYKQEYLCEEITGKVYSSGGELTIKSNKFNYIYVIE